MKSYCVHSLPGRLKIKSRLLKKNRVKMDSVIFTLMELPGIHEVRPNIITGSLLIKYHADVISLDNIVSHLETEGITLKIPSSSSNRLLGSPVKAAGEAAGKAIFSAVVGKVLEDAGLGLVAAII